MLEEIKTECEAKTAALGVTICKMLAELYIQDNVKPNKNRSSFSKLLYATNRHRHSNLRSNKS